MKTTTQKVYLSITALLVWFALIVQFYLHMKNQTGPVPELIIRFFSYFTITTNSMIALCATFLVLKPRTKLTGFFSKQSTQTAIAVYIFVVGLIYNTILRFIWNPQGLQMVVDELLHLIIPIVYIVYWAIFSNKNTLPWKAVFPWLIYPLVYTLFVMIRGSWVDYYPYPFLNVNTLGWNTVLINCIGITFLFILMSLLFLGIGNLIAKKK